MYSEKTVYIVYVMYINRIGEPHLDIALCGYSFSKCRAPVSHRTDVRENGVASGRRHACCVEYLHGLFSGSFARRLCLGPFHQQSFELSQPGAVAIFPMSRAARGIAHASSEQHATSRETQSAALDFLDRHRRRGA